jgi:hypothetical protein
MSNHLHIVVRTRPELTAGWTAREVAERWGVLFPCIDEATGEPGPWPDDAVLAYANDGEWVETRRARLACCSWFMRLLKQRIAPFDSLQKYWQRHWAHTGCPGAANEGYRKLLTRPAFKPSTPYSPTVML